MRGLGRLLPDGLAGPQRERRPASPCLPPILRSGPGRRRGAECPRVDGSPGSPRCKGRHRFERNAGPVVPWSRFLPAGARKTDLDAHPGPCRLNRPAPFSHRLPRDCRCLRDRAWLSRCRRHVRPRRRGLLSRGSCDRRRSRPPTAAPTAASTRRTPWATGIGITRLVSGPGPLDFGADAPICTFFRSASYAFRHGPAGPTVRPWNGPAASPPTATAWRGFRGRIRMVGRNRHRCRSLSTGRGDGLAAGACLYSTQLPARASLFRFGGRHMTWPLLRPNTRPKVTSGSWTRALWCTLFPLGSAAENFVPTHPFASRLRRRFEPHGSRGPLVRNLVSRRRGAVLPGRAHGFPPLRDPV